MKSTSLQAPAPDLTGFAAWLETRPYAQATKRNFTKCVRIAAAVGVSCPEDVDDAFEHRGGPGYRQLIRTSLRAYADFQGARL